MNDYKECMRIEKKGGRSRSALWVFVGVSLFFPLVMFGVFMGSREYLIRRAEGDIETMLLQHKGVHHYVQRLSHPELYSMKKEKGVPPEMYTPVLFSSSYMVRNMHDYYNEEREKAGLPKLYYKMAAENPRNPINQASAYEVALIERFNQDKDCTHFREIVEIDGKKHLYVAIPFFRNEERCLKCHGKFEDAPLQLQLLYPEKGGFDEEIGYIRAIESLRAPLGDEWTLAYIALISAGIVGASFLGLVLINRRLGQKVRNRTVKIHSQARVLEESESNLRIMLNSIGDAVIATDIVGRITRMNPVAEQLTGWGEVEAAGESFEDVFRIIHADSREPIESPVEKVIRTGGKTELSGQTVLIQRSGEERNVADSGAPILDDEGNTVGVVLVFRDVTEQTILEKQVQQSRKMDAIGQLAGGVAHDFNNMLGGIVGSAELLQSQVGDGELDQKLVDIILKASDRATDLTSKLLAFSRKSSLCAEVFDLHDAVYESVTLLEHSLDKRIDIQVDLKAENSRISGDLSQLQNVFLNLGINAGDAMSGGGVLSFSSRTVILEEAYCESSIFDLVSGPYIIVEVRDTGVGMPTHMLPRIFEPFFTTKPSHQGTGLGLAAAFGIVKQHNGSITLYSEEGRGTVFHVALPLVESEVAVVQAESVVSRGTGRILVVDDEEVIRDTAENMLTRLGYEVVLACNGQEAFEVFEREKGCFDLVLMDMVMPVMNGQECFARLIESKPGIPVILCSGFMDDTTIEELKKSGLFGFIQKPYRTVTLSHMVAEACQLKS